MKRTIALAAATATAAVPAVASAHIITHGPLVRRVKAAYRHNDVRKTHSYWFKVPGTAGYWICSPMPGGPVVCEHATRPVVIDGHTYYIPNGIVLTFGPLR